MTDLWERSALELAAAIRSRAVSSTDVVEAHLARIEEVNGAVNAITRPLRDSALSAAETADATIADGTEVGPLHGVPFTIKENIDCIGSPTTNGVPAMANAMPSADAPAVERMKRAGAIPLARTNLSEFALRPSTQNPLHGTTNNPWDATLTAGGSSGGEAAALAVGMTPIGLGNDIGGSVRNPAYCCGVSSLKPTRGRVPLASSIPPVDASLAIALMAVQGPMARTVEDLAVASRVLSGRHRRDSRSVDAPIDGPPLPKIVALVDEIPGPRLGEDAVAAIEFAGAALADSGWIVDRVSPPELEAVHEVWAQVLTADLSAALPLLAGLMSEPSARFLEQACAAHRPAPDQLSGLHVERHRLERRWTEFFARYPAVVCPTWCDRPFVHEADIDPENGLALTLDLLRFITPANALGFPAVAVPTPVRAGLPGGVQVYADHWREDVALDAARDIERATGRLTPIAPADRGS